MYIFLMDAAHWLFLFFCLYFPNNTRDDRSIVVSLDDGLKHSSSIFPTTLPHAKSVTMVVRRQRWLKHSSSLFPTTLLPHVKSVTMVVRAICFCCCLVRGQKNKCGDQIGSTERHDRRAGEGDSLDTCMYHLQAAAAAACLVPWIDTIAIWTRCSRTVPYSTVPSGQAGSVDRGNVFYPWRAFVARVARPPPCFVVLWFVVLGFWGFGVVVFWGFGGFGVLGCWGFCSFVVLGFWVLCLIMEQTQHPAAAFCEQGHDDWL